MDGWGPYVGARIYTGRNFPSPEGVQLAQEVLAADTLTPRFLQEVYSLTYFPQPAWAHLAIDTIAGGLHLHRPDRVAELCFTRPPCIAGPRNSYRRNKENKA